MNPVDLSAVRDGRHDPSGLSLATAAHEAGVVAPVVELPVHDVTVALVIHARDEDAALIVDTLQEYANNLSSAVLSVVASRVTRAEL